MSTKIDFCFVNMKLPETIDVGSIRIAVGDRLRAARKFLGETQVQFAKRLGVGRLSIISYEAGQTAPSVDQLFALEALGLDTSFIAFGFPSLHSLEARRQFLSVMKWVNEECEVRSLDLSDEARLEAAWSAYCRLAEATRHTCDAPDSDALQNNVIKAMSIQDV